MVEAQTARTLAAVLALVFSVLALLSARRLRAARADAATARRIDDLSERLARLEARLAPTPTTPAEDLGPVTGAALRPASPPRRDRPQPAVGPTLIAIPSLAAVPEPNASAEAAETLGRRFATVWTMADAGATAPAIARATGHPVGQVELILGLKRQAPPAERPRA